MYPLPLCTIHHLISPIYIYKVPFVWRFIKATVDDVADSSYFRPTVPRSPDFILPSIVHNHGDGNAGDGSVWLIRRKAQGPGVPFVVLVLNTIFCLHFFTARKRSCGKVMFLYLSVSHSVLPRTLPLPHMPPCHPRPLPHMPVCHASPPPPIWSMSRQCASYRNASLFRNRFLSYSHSSHPTTLSPGSLWYPSHCSHHPVVSLRTIYSSHSISFPSVYHYMFVLQCFNILTDLSVTGCT